MRITLCVLVLLFSLPVLATDSAAYRLFREGVLAWQAGNAARAYAIFESINQPLPPIEDLRLYATAKTAHDIGRDQQAARLFEKLISDYPQSPWKTAAEKKMSVLPPPTPEPEGLEERATFFFRARDYKKAAPLLKELLRRKGGEDLPLLIMLASAYARSSQYDEAITLQKKIMKFPKESRRALYKIVFLQADRNHDREAIAAAQDFLAQYPRAPERDEVQWILAWSHFRLKEWSLAIAGLESYRDMAKSGDRLRRADYWIARSILAMGNKVGAATAFGKIASRDSGDYYGHLASARLRHKSVAWQLPVRKVVIGRLRPETAESLLASLQLYEFMPIVGWEGGYASLVEAAAPAWGLTAPLVTAVIQVESHFRPTVVSSAGAVGLMQLIPPTAIQLSDEMNLDTFSLADLRDPVWNVTLGMAYLRKLSGMFGRNLVAMIAAYNAGEQAVARWIAQTPLTDPEIFVEEIPYDETYAYVKKVISQVW